MMMIKLPGFLKKLKPIHWAIIGGVVLAVIFLIKNKGTGAVANSGLVPSTGTGGSGGTTDPSLTVPPVSGQPPVDWMSLLSDQQAAQNAANAAWQAQLLALMQGGTGQLGTGLPGGTVSPSLGLPALVQGAYGNTVPMATLPTATDHASQLSALLGGASPATLFGTVVNDAGPTANLTGPEYAATTINTGLNVDFLAQTQAWQAANVGSATYAEQLFNRLNLLANNMKAGGNTNPTLGPAITATQAEINRVEQISSGTGVGPVDRNIPILPSALGQGLLVGEGVYTTGTPQIQALLTAAGIGAAPGAAPGISPGGTTAAATAADAARIATLTTAIATQTHNIATLTAAGKVGTSAYNTDSATLNKYKKELAGLTG
jgi:hypothetical protein